MTSSERPQISVVVPVYDMPEPLTLCVKRLAEQAERVQAEVIIVDDGSDEPTQLAGTRLTQEFACVSFVHRPRDGASGRSTARNLGIERARGRTIVFVDAGVCAGDGFLERFSEASTRYPRDVLLCEIYGVAMLGDWDAARLSQWLDDPTTIPEEWNDTRRGLFRLCRGDLSRLPAPWTLGWTGALAIPADAARQMNGFDTKFRLWGGEDVEFTLRALQLGLGCRALDTFAVRIPHQRPDARSERAAPREGLPGQDNRRLLQELHPSRESELLRHLTGVSVNVFAMRLDQLAREYVVPPAAGLLGALGALGQQDLRTLALFPPSGRVQRALNPHLTLVHSALERDALAAEHSVSRVEVGLGSALLVEDGHFDRVVVHDLIRAFPGWLRSAILREALRVGDELCLALGDGNAPVRSDRNGDNTGWGWATIETIHDELLAQGATCETVRRDDVRLLLARPTPA